MNDFASSYVGQLRKLVGNRRLLVPGARIVIEDSRQRILLQHRSDFGVWGLPGGNAEEGEDLSDLVVREVREETGLDVFDIEPFGFSSNPLLESFVYPNGDRTQHFSLNFFTRKYSGTLDASDEESLELSWFSVGELPEMLPNMRESISAFERYIGSKQFQLF